MTDMRRFDVELRRDAEQARIITVEAEDEEAARRIAASLDHSDPEGWFLRGGATPARIHEVRDERVISEVYVRRDTAEACLRAYHTLKPVMYDPAAPIVGGAVPLLDGMTLQPDTRTVLWLQVVANTEELAAERTRAMLKRHGLHGGPVTSARVTRNPHRPIYR